MATSLSGDVLLSITQKDFYIKILIRGDMKPTLTQKMCLIKHRGRLPLNQLMFWVSYRASQYKARRLLPICKEG